MKLILAIIQPAKLEAVKEALNKVEVFRLTIVDVQGFGRQKGHSEAFRGHEVTTNLLRKVQLQIAVNEDFVEPTVNAIMEAGRTGPEGRIGDGKIFILPLEDAIRIRTGERGPEAISILLLSDDLVDASKTMGHAQANGVHVVQCKSQVAAIVRMDVEEIVCCIVDLHLPGLNLDELLSALSRQEKKPRIIAYGSHVDAARLSAARKAGFGEVMPRSKYFEEMPARIAEWGKEI